MTFGVTSSGFVTPTGTQVYTGLIESFTQSLGSDIDVSPQSVTGQFVAVFAQIITNMWQNLAMCYQSAYPAGAQGIALDSIAQIVGLVRQGATRTQAYISCGGTLGTIIPAGSLVSAGSSAPIFVTSSAITISDASCCIYTVGIPTTPTASAYTVIINSISCSYYQPIITFSTALVTGNQIAVTINGTNLGTVDFTTDSPTTINAIIALINGSTPQLASASTPDTNTILLVPSTGVTLIVAFAITGGATQPTYATTYNAPTFSQVQAGLASVVNASSVAGACVASASGAVGITLQATSFASPLSISTSTPLTTVGVQSPSLAYSQQAGAIEAAPNSITSILSPIYGWTSANNPLQPILGRATETDSSLRLRIFSAGASNAYATVSAITAKLLANSVVTYASVFENTTLTQLTSTITFSAAFVSGNSISISLNGVTVVNLLYNTSQAVTMGLITSALQTYASVASASASGNVVSITWNPIGTTLITQAAVTGGATVPSVTYVDGIAPLSIRAVVQGTNTQSIGDTIYATKAAGIQTMGNTTVVVNTPNGNASTVYYQTPQQIYIWVSCAVVSNSSSAVASSVQGAILSFGSGLGVGNDVYLYSVNSAPSGISGITSISTQIAFTQSPTDTPVFGSGNIAISETQISSWSASRILVTVS